MEYSRTPNLAEVLSIKDKSELDLIDDLLECAREWEPQWQEKLEQAIHLAQDIHKDDRHRQQPYIYHVLRCANRVVQHLDQRDPEIIIASILHDSVEDHAEEIIDTYIIRDGDVTSHGTTDVLPPSEQQTLALLVLEQQFSPGVSEIVGGLTNSPLLDHYDNSLDKIHAYAGKVQTSIRDERVFIDKVSDWIDNGLGIVHDSETSLAKYQYRQTKYGYVLPVFETRFYEDDMQVMLSPKAKVYLEQQFALGRARLIVPV